MEAKKANIYCLINPIDNNVFYVGATIFPIAKRCQQHISEAKKSRYHPPFKSGTAKNNCINSILHHGFVPEFKLLESAEYSKGQERENWWYNEMVRQGNILLQDEYKLNYSSRETLSDPDRKILVYKFESDLFESFYSETYCHYEIIQLISENIRSIEANESVSFLATRIAMSKKEYYDIVFEPRRQKILKSFKNKKKTKIISS